MSTSQVYGIHAVSRRLEQAPGGCIELYCLERRNARLEQIVERARRAGVAVTCESRAALAARCGSDKHQGCVLATRESQPAMTLRQCLDSVAADTLLLVLDGVQDPHNLGACLRTADACGVDAVIIPRDRAAQMNATVRKVAAGGAESVPLIAVTNLARCLRELRAAGVWIYGTSGGAIETLYQQDFSGPVALVMGGEGSGLRRLTTEACDRVFSLPMLGQVESLNISVAAGVCLYEILRSRGAARPGPDSK
jgi:23S rRNA (guanosine2251-2'-O)-methyltransferase